MINTKDIATRLIIDNLINYKLVDGLNLLNVTATDYYLEHHSNIILELMDVQLNDAQFDEVEAMYDDVSEIDINQPKELKTLATSIYNAILDYKM